MREVLACVGAGMVGMRGSAHAIQTPQVVGGFEPTSTDNHRVILQERLAEAFAM
jgi:hypothetical protein